MLGEFLERRTERGQIKVHAGDPGILELLEALADRSRHLGFHVLPIDMLIGVNAASARAARQKHRAVCRGLVPDVEAAFGFGVDWPRCSDGKARFHQSHGERIPGAGRLVGEHERHDAVGL